MKDFREICTLIFREKNSQKVIQIFLKIDFFFVKTDMNIFHEKTHEKYSDYFDFGK